MTASDTCEWITGIYLMTVGMLGTFGNATVITVVLKFWSRKNLSRKPHLPLILSLATSDLCITFFGYPYSSLSGYAGRWLFDDHVCKMVGFCCFFLSMASLDILLAISVYRYITICRPALKSQLSLRTSGVVIVACWAYAILWAAPPLFGLSEYTLEPFGTSCSMNWTSRKHVDIAFLIGTDIFCFLLHLLVLIICYYKVSLLSVVAFFIVWSPYAIVCTWEVFGGRLPPGATVLPTMFAKSSCAFNPILYGACDKHFRQTAKRLLCPCQYNAVGSTRTRNRYTSRRPISMDIFATRTDDSSNPQSAGGDPGNIQQKSPNVPSDTNHLHPDRAKRGKALILTPACEHMEVDTDQRRKASVNNTTTTNTVSENTYRVSLSMSRCVDSRLRVPARHSIHTDQAELTDHDLSIKSSYVSLNFHSLYPNNRQCQAQDSKPTFRTEDMLKKCDPSVPKFPKIRSVLGKRSASLYTLFGFATQDHASVDKSVRYSLGTETTDSRETLDDVKKSCLKERPDGEKFSDVLVSKVSSDTDQSLSLFCNLQAPINHCSLAKPFPQERGSDDVRNAPATSRLSASAQPTLQNALRNLTVKVFMEKVKLRSHNLYHASQSRTFQPCPQKGTLPFSTEQ